MEALHVLKAFTGLDPIWAGMGFTMGFLARFNLKRPTPFIPLLVESFFFGYITMAAAITASAATVHMGLEECFSTSLLTSAATLTVALAGLHCRMTDTFVFTL
eukprot:TRINITY_DN29828_c0_g1_i1.p1 TRINITY_DN29828_c0_g1~~TRINITY_DN29828_c0_g1_i1.p1  ORF type:complete len:103 (+),score=17.90 TRINITY_DN29828_c0_g1_i1:208-516(+)